MKSSMLLLFLLVAVLTASSASSALQLRYEDATCNILGNGGDVISAAVVECEDCKTLSCLHMIHNTKTTWDTGREYCEKLSDLSAQIESSHLVTILTEQKLEVVKTFLDNLDSLLQPRSVWIGLHSASATSTCSTWERFKCFMGGYCGCRQWMWLDAIPFEGTPQYWSAGQPGGAWSINGGDCVKMARDHDWRYFDDPCSTSMNFLRQANAVLCEASVSA